MAEYPRPGRPLFRRRTDPAKHVPAQRHLARRDAVMRQLIRQVGPCTLWHSPDRFAVLVRSIISQQLSTKAAASIGERLQAALAPDGLTPARVVAATEAELRGAGLSGAKVRSLQDLAARVHTGALPLRGLHRLSDEDVIARLVPVRGISRWTAQMFLIFCLGRADVLPVDDLGLRVGAQRQYGLAEPPRRAELEVLAEPWRPYRTVATWYLWRSLGFVPQSQ